VVRCLSAGSVAFSRPSLAQSESGTLSAPYWAYHTGGSWASKESRCGAILLEYDDGTYAELDAIELFPFHAFTGTSFASNSTPDERGILWTPTFTCKVRGGWYYGSANNVVDAVLYDGTSPLCTISIDPDTNTKGSSSFRRSVIFDAQYTLTAGNPYRLILKPTSTSAISLVSFDVASAGYLAAFAGGTAIQHTERTDGGSFSQTSTRRSFMGFHISAIQTDPGGGALLVHPGMAGGMRG
jgi:hypothetical protein